MRGRQKTSGFGMFLLLLVVSVAGALIIDFVLSILLIPLFILIDPFFSFLIDIGIFVLVWAIIYRIFYKGRSFQ